MSCVHLAEAGTVAPAVEGDGCSGCLADGRTDWLGLRACVTCGHVGCCDSSPGQHATAHFSQSGHPVMRSIQPGESWRWCYLDEEMG